MVVAFIYPVLYWIDKPQYFDRMPVFFILLTSSVVYIIGHIPHYTLYAMGQDRIIVAANLVGLGLFVVTGMVLASYYSLIGVGAALLLSLTINAGIKQWWLIVKETPSTA